MLVELAGMPAAWTVMTFWDDLAVSLEEKKKLDRQSLYSSHLIVSFSNLPFLQSLLASRIYLSNLFDLAEKP